MQMTRITPDNVTTLVYALITRLGLAVKFKVKLYTKDKDQNEQYYYQEFLLPKDKVTVNLSPRPYLEWIIAVPGTDDAKVAIYVTEIYKNRIVRKLRKIAQAFEAYDDQECDIIVVDQTGTHIHSEIAKPIKVVVGTQTLLFTPVLMDSTGEVGMRISSANAVSTIGVKDFLLLYSRLDELNFTEMTMLLCTYLSSMPLGTHRTDFRKDKLNSSLENIAPFEAAQYSRVNVMGSLIDIENPSGLIQVDTTSKKPKW